MAETQYGPVPDTRAADSSIRTLRNFNANYDSVLERCANWGDARISSSGKKTYVRFAVEGAYGGDDRRRLALFIPTAWFSTSQNLTTSLTSRASSRPGAVVCQDIYDIFNTVSSWIDTFEFVSEADGEADFKIKCKSESVASYLLGYVVAVKRLATYLRGLQYKWTIDPAYAGTGLRLAITSSGYGGGAANVAVGYILPYSEEKHEAWLAAEEIQTEITENKVEQSKNMADAAKLDLERSSYEYRKEEVDNGTTMWKTLRYIGLGVVILLLIPVVLNFFKKQKGKK